MGAGLATTAEEKKQDSSRESSASNSTQWAPSRFTPSGLGAWGDAPHNSRSRPTGLGARSGMPLFLQPQIQMKCAECSKEDQEEEEKEGKKEENPPVQKKCAHCEEEDRRQQEEGAPPVQTKCPACEAQGLKAKSTTGAAREGVANANRSLPHQDRIQASFGHHDISGTRASVGGEAAEASSSMGALAYTSGDRVAFRNEPDVNLAAHEAAHVVQQRNGAKLPGGVGRAGDEYEQQADAAASAVERGESAEGILDRNISGNSGADAATQVQHRLEINATRIYEPPMGMSDAMLGGDLGRGGKGKGKASPSKKSASKAGDKEKEDKADAKDEGSKNGASGAVGAQPASRGSSSHPAQRSGGDSLSTNASAPGTLPTGGAGPVPGSPNTSTTAPQANASAPPASPSGTPGTGTTPPAAPAPAEEPPASGASCTPACYEGKKEDPPEDKKSDKQPANPPGGDSQEQTSDGDEPDLPEPDDCSTQQAQAGVPSDGQSATDGGTPSKASGVPASASGSTPSSAAGTAGPSPVPGGAAQAGGAKAASAKGKGPDGADKAGGGGKGRAAARAEAASPMEGAISQTEAQRAASVAAYENSSKMLDISSANSAELRAGVEFASPSSGGEAEAPRRAEGASRANRFFNHAADRLDEAVFFASSDMPDLLGSQSESGKAQILASAEAQKEAVSARIAAGRAEARGDAAIAKRAVTQQSESFIEEVHSSSAAAIAALTASHAATMAQVDTFETTTLDQVNEIYANGRVQLEGLGTTIGDECTAVGEQYATTYEGFEHCTENGFWDGDLSERRAYAQAKAARKTAKGKHDGIVDAAKKRAREVVRSGRKSNRCQVITTASNTRKELDETLTQLTATIESSRDHAIEQANNTRTSLLGAIENALGATLRQLNQQEHDQRQMIDDTCYLQQVVQEQLAHTAASSLQSVVGNAASALHDSLFTLRAQFASNGSPDPKALDEALTAVSANVDAALDGLQQGLIAGTTSSVEHLATSLDAGLNALDELVASNDETATALLNGFGAGMGAIAGQDNFATQRAGFAQLVQQATSGGTDAFQQMFDGMREGCGKTLEDSRKSLKQAGIDLEKSLRKSKLGIECEITKAADEAASHEAPAWKMLVAILLIIVVIVIVIAVTILTAGAGLGLLAVIAIGAVVGAVTSGLITMATNLWTNQDVMQGVGEAMIMGAITGAAGGVIGMGVGAVVGKVAGTAISVAAKEIVTVILSTAIIDVGTQLYEGKGSLKNFSFKQLGFDLALALVMHKALGGAGHAEVEGPHPGAPAVEPPTVEPTARPAAPEPAPVEPRPTEPTPAEPAPAEAKPAEPAPAEAKPTEPAPAEAKPPEPPPAEAKPSEVAPAEPAPMEPRPAEPTAPEATPAEAGPPKEGKPGEAAPGETREPGTPSEPGAPGELAPPGEAPMSPQEKTVLDSTANKPSSELTPEEVRTETEVANRTQGEPINEPPFTTEKELPNGHEMKQTADGELCERCTECQIFNKEGKRMGTVSAGPNGELVEHPISTPEVERVRPGTRPSAEPAYSASPEPPEPVEVPRGPTEQEIRAHEQLEEHLEEVTGTSRQTDQAEHEAAAHKVTDQANPRPSESTSGPERARAEIEAQERGPHPDDMRGNEADIGSTVPDEIPEGGLFQPDTPEVTDPYAHLRSQTPSPELREQFNPPGDKFDPVYGHKVDTLVPDHIVPMKEITQMPGFDELTPQGQLEVLNLEENFMGMDPRVNSSKGARTYGGQGEGLWEGHPEFGPIPEDFRAAMKIREAELRIRLQEEIDARLPK